VSNTLGGVVAGGRFGAIIGFCVGWFLVPHPTDAQGPAVTLGAILFGCGTVTGAVVGAVEDIFTGQRKLGPSPPDAPRT